MLFLAAVAMLKAWSTSSGRITGGSSRLRWSGGAVVTGDCDPSKSLACFILGLEDMHAECGWFEVYFDK